jgi:hypothetical protein
VVEGCKIGRRHVKMLMPQMIEALYRRPRATKPLSSVCIVAVWQCSIAHADPRVTRGLPGNPATSVRLHRAQRSASTRRTRAGVNQY